MRLIDADTLPCDICDFQKCPCYNPLYCRDFNKWFKATAYDVDKVVKELWENYGDNRISNAINIVKRGGVDEID